MLALDKVLDPLPPTPTDQLQAAGKPLPSGSAMSFSRPFLPITRGGGKAQAAAVVVVVD